MITIIIYDNYGYTNQAEVCRVPAASMDQARAWLTKKGYFAHEGLLFDNGDRWAEVLIEQGVAA